MLYSPHAAICEFPGPYLCNEPKLLKKQLFSPQIYCVTGFHAPFSLHLRDEARIVDSLAQAPLSPL
jgi:hypothetical protein